MTYFSVRSGWVGYDELTKDIFGRDEVVIPAVRMGETPVFILDYVCFVGESRHVKRIMFSDYYDVADFLEDSNHNGYKISLLVMRDQNMGEFYISDLVEVFVAEDEYGQEVLIYQCKDGRRHFHFGMISKEEWSNIERIYSNTEHVSEW